MEREGRNVKKKKSWQSAKHAWLFSGLLQTLKGELLIALGFQKRGFYVTVVPYCERESLIIRRLYKGDLPQTVCPRTKLLSAWVQDHSRL